MSTKASSMPATQEIDTTVPSGQRQTLSRNWSLIVFRWIVCIVFLCLFGSHINDVIFYYTIISRYFNVPGCDFVQFQISVFISCLIMLPILLVGPVLLLKQHVKQLRSYMPFLFVGTWLHFLIILVAVQSYPLVHEIHVKWNQGESISSYESKYQCCGILGPDDYMLKYGALPSSCFRDDDKLKGALFTSGCLGVRSVKARLIRNEMITSVVGLVLLMLVLGFYFYMKKVNATERNCTQLRQAYIIL